jgi:radical SAM protein with 4Fe4S-binding SPASM domain
MGNALINFDSVVPRMSLAAPYIKEGLKIGIKAGKIVMAEAMPYCLMKGYEDYVAEKTIPQTEIRGKTFQNTNDFTKVRQKEGKMKFPNCKKCKYDSICEGTWKEYPEHFGYEEFKPITEEKNDK